MNNKGFTLIELLAVIVILGLIASIATPNVLNMINNSKNEQYVAFANELLAKGKYYYNLKDKYETYFDISGSCYEITSKNLGFSDVKDPDGGIYDAEKTKVKICIENSTLEYYVKVYGSKKGIFDDTKDESYLNEENLNINSVSSY